MVSDPTPALVQKLCVLIFFELFNHVPYPEENLSAFVKVLNGGLGPHEYQNAEMVLILHKSPNFPILF